MRTPIFVVFEGIDGGGKTTLSNMVAEGLRARALATEHVREGGVFASSVTQAMRELGRDARNLALAPRAELLLYLTREVQLVEEATRPALGRADVVIADRFVYTAEALAIHGRGMPAAEVAPLVSAATDLVPDLVVLVDVDPQIARARRRVSKLLVGETKPPSRKGLAGTALQLRLRAGYLERAAREPDRWVVVDNTDADLAATANALVDLIATVHAAPSSIRTAAAALPTTSRRHPAVHDVAQARDALAAWIDARSPREPGLAAYFLAGVPGRQFDRRRDELAQHAPRVVASGLRWLDEDAAWALRRRLAAEAPREVASTLVGPAAARAEAATLLRALAPQAPREVGSALWGRDDAVAWEVRGLLAGDPLVRSLGNVPGARAWTLREEWLRSHGGLAGAVQHVAVAAIACDSVAGLSDDRAWQIRKAARAEAPVAALDSTYLLTSERAWKWRRRAIDRAPKVVMRTIAGLDDEAAWELRERVAGHCEEALDSIIGLDSERAWTLRERAVALWPATVVKSMGLLARGERGLALVARALAAQPANVALWRQVSIRCFAEERTW